MATAAREEILVKKERPAALRVSDRLEGGVFKLASGAGSGALPMAAQAANLQQHDERDNFEWHGWKIDVFNRSVAEKIASISSDDVIA
jgi:hypothetical protein